MESNHTIVYVMRHIDIGGYIDIPYKKVGITGSGNATLSRRLQQISSTKSPIKAQCIAAWKHEDAKKVEMAIHELLNDCRVEGEWFYDKDDNLQDRLVSLMELVNAEQIEITDENDSYTKSIMKKEEDQQLSRGAIILAEIEKGLNSSLRSSVRQIGPTIFSDKTNLTFYINMRKSGVHHVGVGRSKICFEELKNFLESKDYEVIEDRGGNVHLQDMTNDRVIELINTIESEFSGHGSGD